LGYFVIAPAEQLHRPPLSEQLDKSLIQAKVERRIGEYSAAKDQWLRRWFLPTLEQIQVVGMSWEEVIAFIDRKDPAAAKKLRSFYQACLQHNR
jgi:hypothetical protein